MREQVVIPQSKATELEVQFEGDITTGAITKPMGGLHEHHPVRLDEQKARTLRVLVSELRGWAAGERAHFLRHCRCRPQLTAPLIEGLKALNALSIRDFLVEQK